MSFIRSACLVFAALWFVAISVQAAPISETEVEVAPGVLGTLATASSASPKAAVLLLHGWTGHRDEVGDMFKRTAAQLAEKGIASLRIDFRGEGERNGHRLTSTFAGRIADAEAALAFLQQRHPNTPIGVVGFSLGGATSLALIGNHPEAVKSLVLWSTAGDLAVDFFTNEELKPAIREAMETGESVHQSWTTLTITREHMAGMTGYDLFSPLANYQGALLAIRGTNDYVANYDPRILAAANGDPEEIVTIGNADHIFNTLDSASTHDERAIGRTVVWLAQTL